MANDTRSERLLDMQRRFMDGARLTIDRMMSDYGADRRTLNRDLNTLIDSGLKIESVRGQDNKKIWSLATRSRKIPVPFNLTDLTALFMGRRLFDFLRGTLLEESLDKVYGAIETRLDREKDLLKSKDLANKVYLVSEGPKKLLKRHIDSLDEVLTGLLDERRIELTYENARGEKNRFELEPYSLVAFRRGLYLVARIHESEAIFTFALERMSRVKAIRGAHFDYPKDFEPETYFKDALFIRYGTPEKVELVFSPGSEKFVRIRRFHHTQRMKTLKDRSLQLTMKVPVGDELMYWVLSFGKNVEVTQPENLREMMRKELDSARSHY